MKKSFTFLSLLLISVISLTFLSSCSYGSFKEDAHTQAKAFFEAYNSGDLEAQWDLTHIRFKEVTTKDHWAMFAQAMENTLGGYVGMEINNNSYSFNSGTGDNYKQLVMECLIEFENEAVPTEVIMVTTDGGPVGVLSLDFDSDNLIAELNRLSTEGVAAD